MDCCNCKRSWQIQTPSWQGIAMVTIVMSSFLVVSCDNGIMRLSLVRTINRGGKELDDPRYMKHQENNLKGKPGQGYYVQMELGTPAQKLNMLVDTGSSNFAVAAASHPSVDDYFDSSLSKTFKLIGTEVYVPYTQGDWKGFLGQDVVALTSLPNVTVTANIACITSSDSFFINGSNWQGILGLAYAEIARPDDSIEPFFDSLISQTAVNNSFSMQLCGTINAGNSSDVSVGGTMIIGGLDPSLYTGPMLYAMIHKEWYYEVILTDIRVDHHSISMDCKEYNFDKAIVDSGTTNLRLPKKVYEKVLEDIMDSTMLDQEPPNAFWSGDDVLCWPQGNVPWMSFPSLTLTLAESVNTTFDLVISPQQYLRAVGDDYDCFKFAIAPSDTGTVLGAVIMEGFYVQFDRANSRVGFAKSTCPNRDSMAQSSYVVGPKAVIYDPIDCAYVKPESHQNVLVTVAYIIGAICGACLFPLIYIVVQWVWQSIRRRNSSDHDVANLLKEDEER